jgi:hypothetical protein
MSPWPVARLLEVSKVGNGHNVLFLPFFFSLFSLLSSRKGFRSHSVKLEIRVNFIHLDLVSVLIKVFEWEG